MRLSFQCAFSGIRDQLLLENICNSHSKGRTVYLEPGSVIGDVVLSHINALTSEKGIYLILPSSLSLRMSPVTSITL